MLHGVFDNMIYNKVDGTLNNMPIVHFTACLTLIACLIEVFQISLQSYYKLCSETDIVTHRRKLSKFCSNVFLVARTCCVCLGQSLTLHHTSPLVKQSLTLTNCAPSETSYHKDYSAARFAQFSATTAETSGPSVLEPR